LAGLIALLQYIEKQVYNWDDRHRTQYIFQSVLLNMMMFCLICRKFCKIFFLEKHHFYRYEIRIKKLIEQFFTNSGLISSYHLDLIDRSSLSIFAGVGFPTVIMQKQKIDISILGSHYDQSRPGWGCEFELFDNDRESITNGSKEEYKLSLHLLTKVSVNLKNVNIHSWHALSNAYD
jgi:hypothetical protein